jgi:hypothetical protein
MTEEMGGPLIPLFSKYIPPFDESFEKFAADLKREAETIQRSKKQCEGESIWKKERKKNPGN